jgi:AcrR family transcriptional regulator
LGEALMTLIQEKPFDAITVQELLDRAGVGRSTFYEYFRDKNDLFVTDLDEFLEGMATTLVGHSDAGDRVAPVRELFGHVAESRQLYDALVASGRIHDFLDLGRAHFARGIEQRLVELTRARTLAPGRRAAVAHALAGALLSLLLWWIDGKRTASPAEMDDLFHGIVWSAVACTGRGFDPTGE